MTREEVVYIMQDVCIKVLGAEKWNSMTIEQKHDAVMILVKDTLKALENC